MKITPLTAVILAILFLLIVLPFINASNQSGGQPAWFKAYESAREAALAKNDAERERQVNLVYEESSRYGGAMPPAEKMDFNQSLMENLLWFVPMQDRGVTTTYTQALRSLASSFENEKRWDDAERFLRKAYELELAEKRIHPKSRIRPDTSELVNLLFKRGKRAEALKLQWEDIAELEAVAAEHGNSGYYLEPVLYQKAKVFEMEGKVDDAETCMKRIVEYYNYEINDKSLAELKKYNAKSEPAREGTCSLNMISRLENLADFYKRHDNHTGQEQTLAKILSLHQATMLADSPRIAEDWDKLATQYKKHHKYDRAEEAMLKSIRVLQANWDNRKKRYLLLNKDGQGDKARQEEMAQQAEWDDRDKSNIASTYFRYAKIMELDGKKSEALAARSEASKFDPRITDSVSSGD